MSADLSMLLDTARADALREVRDVIHAAGNLKTGCCQSALADVFSALGPKLDAPRGEGALWNPTTGDA